MKIFVQSLAFFVFAFFLSGVCLNHHAFASNEDKEKTAKAMVEDAVSYYKSVGEAKALEAFNATTEGRFKKGEFYIYAIDKTGKTLAHGASAAMVGKDVSGFPFIKDSMALIKDDKGEGWIDYMWTNPTTKKLAKKKSYIKALGSDNKFVGCGFYKE